MWIMRHLPSYDRLLQTLSNMTSCTSLECPTFPVSCSPRVVGDTPTGPLDLGRSGEDHLDVLLHEPFSTLDR